MGSSLVMHMERGGGHAGGGGGWGGGHSSSGNCGHPSGPLADGGGDPEADEVRSEAEP